LLVAATADGVVAVDLFTGELRWRAGPADDDRLRVATDGTAVAVTGDELTLLDAATGAVQGTAALRDPALAVPAVGAGSAYVAAGPTVEALAPPT
jgi:hypothetical protein